MLGYIVERYEVFHSLFLWGWVFYVVGTCIGVGVLITLDRDDPHKGQKQYYGILLIAALFIIGLIGTIFLPSPELVKGWLQ
ncbi:MULTISPECIES: hypothetical protein [Acinetobacter]|uniref:Uncharacterized protein n=1 Tax=Acinetobacter higginsii TaxID=70347 RepID=N9RLA8_9GAMM|nr:MULTISPECIES: hypothetical protein [Acinetobacter]ENX58768.1 hypothetical protein F902_01395 [Acinetobacter higginsii]